MFIKYPERIEIYKVKDWCVYFRYEGEHYMVYTGGDAYEECTTLYKKKIDADGRYELEAIKTIWESFPYRSYTRTPYKFTDKNKFVYALTVRGLCHSKYSKCLNKRKEKIRELESQIRELEAKISKLM